MAAQGEYDSFEQGNQAMTSAGDKAVFSIPFPVDVVRWGFTVVSVAMDVGAGFAIALDKRPTAGSDSGRVAAAGGAIVLGVDEDLALGTGAYHDLPTPLALNPGEQLVFIVTDLADTTGTVQLWAHYRRQPFVAPRISRMKKK